MQNALLEAFNYPVFDTSSETLEPTSSSQRKEPKSVKSKGKFLQKLKFK